jgi:predicted ATP-dependent serine protease
MNIVKIYICKFCGFGSNKAGECPRCEAVLLEYGREEQAEEQAYMDVQNAMRSMSDLKWYV